MRWQIFENKHWNSGAFEHALIFEDLIKEAGNVLLCQIFKNKFSTELYKKGVRIFLKKEGTLGKTMKKCKKNQKRISHKTLLPYMQRLLKNSKR